MNTYEVAIYSRSNSKKSNRKEYFDTLNEAQIFAKDFKNNEIKEYQVADVDSDIISFKYGNYYYKSF